MFNVELEEATFITFRSGSVLKFVFFSQTLNSSSRSSATASVLTEFIPIYDTLNDLKSKYADNEFGSKYGGLTMKPTFSKLGVEAYTAEEGTPIDTYRMNVVENEYSKKHAKNTVVRPVSMGMELQGNVMRPAECVASLGAQEEGKDAKKDEEPDASVDLLESEEDSKN